MDAQPRRSRWPVVLIILLLLGGVGLWWRFGRTPEAVAGTVESPPPPQVAATTPAPPTAASTAPNRTTVDAEPMARGVFIQRADAGTRDPSVPAEGAPVQPSDSSRGSSTGTAATGTAAGAWGAIEGQITTTRSVPPSPPIAMSSDPYCAKQGKAEPPSASIDDKGRVRGASVRVASGAGLPAPSEPLIVEQRGCQYTPRVQNAVAGQVVSVRNEDGTLHNVHSYSGTRTLANQAQPPKSRAVSLSADAANPVLKLRCDVHPWMTGYVVFNQNAFFAVSDPAGHYRIDPAPAGQYTLHVWQEILGETEVSIQVLPGQTTVANIAYAKSSQ